jgi:hypothetical protein
MKNSLRLYKDNRTGLKLELVLCIRNDFERIFNFIKNYYLYADIVILSCDNISDINKFINKCKEFNFYFSLFIRNDINKLTENVFIEYLNNFSSSGRALFICTDELIGLSDIERADNAILNNKVVLINRIDYLFYRRIKKYRNIIRGGSPGDFIESGVLTPHRNILTSFKKAKVTIDIHHLSDQYFTNEYSKIIEYIKLEIYHFSSNRYPFIYGIKRFFIQLFRDLLNLKMLFNAGLKIYIYNFFLNLFCATVYILILIESSIDVKSNKSKIINKIINEK